MRTRRPVAVFLASLALVGAAGLTGCGAQSQTFRTGTPADHAQLTTGNDPSSDRQGNLPDASNRQPSSTETKGGVGAGGNQNNNG
jgi:hypothetical protein